MLMSTCQHQQGFEGRVQADDTEDRFVGETYNVAIVDTWRRLIKLLPPEDLLMSSYDFS